MILMVIILMSTNGLRGNSRCKLQQIKIIQINYPKDGVGICSVSPILSLEDKDPLPFLCLCCLERMTRISVAVKVFHLH